MKRLGTLLSIVTLIVATTACEAAKSANPLSPAVAGPIPGVSISAPKPLEPANTKIAVEQQPVTLLAEIAGSNGPRPLSYVFEVAVDANFSTKVFVAENGAPCANGGTSVRIADRLAPEHSYFWRVKAQDGANTGPYSPVL